MKEYSGQHKETVRASNKGLVLLNFFVNWSTPCDTQAIILDELSKVSNGSVNIIKVNIDDPGNESEGYNIKAVPTLCLLKDGIEVNRFIGVQKLDTLLEAIKIYYNETATE